MNLVDPVFDQGHTDKYKLSILLLPDGFSFCVLDTRTLTYVAIGDYSGKPSELSVSPRKDTQWDHLRNQIQEVDLFRHNYVKIDLAYGSPKVTLVPPGFLQDEPGEHYFRFNHSLDASEVIKSQVIPVGEMTALFSVPSGIVQVSRELFPGAALGCTASALIQGLLMANAHILARQVFIHTWGNYFDIVVIQGRRLLYFNTFIKHAPEDLAYYVIYVLEQLGFIPAEEQVVLMGDIAKDSDEFNLLYQYIDRIHFAGLDTDAGFSPVFSEVLVHRYYLLFTLPFCE